MLPLSSLVLRGWPSIEVPVQMQKYTKGLVIERNPSDVVLQCRHQGFMSIVTFLLRTIMHSEPWHSSMQNFSNNNLSLTGWLNQRFQTGYQIKLFKYLMEIYFALASLYDSNVTKDVKLNFYSKNPEEMYH